MSSVSEMDGIAYTKRNRGLILYMSIVTVLICLVAGVEVKMSARFYAAADRHSLAGFSWCVAYLICLPILPTGTWALIQYLIERRVSIPTLLCVHAVFLIALCALTLWTSTVRP